MRFALALLAGLLIAAPAQAAAPALSPAPNTPDANAATQISIYGVKSSAIGKVRVVGATSGSHSGSLHDYSRKDGASFIPDQPFTAGEKVAVTVPFKDGQKTRKWSFTVATPAAAPPILNFTQNQDAKLQHFVSAPDLLAPQITVRKAGGSDSSIFLTPLPSPVVHPGSKVTITINPVGPGGPMITDRNGKLVWFRPFTPPKVAANLRIQRYHGKRVLTWWEGPVTAAAYGLGTAVIADSSYRTIRTVKAGNGYSMDLHEFELTKRGTALFTVYTPVMTKLPSGEEHLVLDALVQEVDIKTGLVVWEWHSLGHIGLEESLATAANSAYYDAFHINSIQDLPGGSVLISARDTAALYKIRRAGSRIQWRLGGKASDFRFGKDAKFYLQHNALLHGDQVTMFDDEAGPPQKRDRSRGLVLKLDFKHMKATHVLSLDRPGKTSAQSEGSNQALPGGGWFVGFGAEEWFSEFSATGKLRFDAHLPVDDGSYRVVRFPWHATPVTKPVVVVQNGAASMSWNGATDVTRWRISSGPDAQHLSRIKTVNRTGFETTTPVPSAAVYAVDALAKDGTVLGSSK